LMIKNTPKGRKFNFSEYGIPEGAILEFIKDTSITCEVTTDSNVIYNGEIKSLSASALDAVHRCGFEWRQIAGPDFWTYKGSTLSIIRHRSQVLASRAKAREVNS
jgi:hypothetical protein